MKITSAMYPWIGFILGICALVGVLIYAGEKNNGEKTISETVGQEEHVKGASEPKAILVEYSDFQCPACAATYPVIKQLAEDYADSLQVVYRHFPLSSIHEHAVDAAVVAEAAAKQGKFWEMHDMLFNTQREWSNSENTTAFFETLAESLGLDMEQFKTDVQSEELRNLVLDARGKALSLRLSGTPTFFLNGKQITHPGSYAGFKTVIENALAE